MIPVVCDLLGGWGRKKVESIGIIKDGTAVCVVGYIEPVFRSIEEMELYLSPTRQGVLDIAPFPANLLWSFT